MRDPPRVLLHTPAPRGSRRGNRVTALRWAAQLRSLGWSVRVLRSDERPDTQASVVVALHAVHGHEALRRARAASLPTVLVLTGTDLYGEWSDDRRVPASFEHADRIVVLQPLAARRVPPPHRSRVFVLPPAAAAPPAKEAEGRTVLVMAHLRAVKDPRLPAAAVSRLPEDSSVRIVHLGAALDEEHRAWAERESRSNPRWTWLGGLRRRAALERLAGAFALLVPSRGEGGSQALVEAVVAGVPVIASDAEGNVGLLGRDHPGLFPAGDADALAELLLRLDADENLYDRLRERSRRLAPRHAPARERHELRALFAPLFGDST